MRGRIVDRLRDLPAGEALRVDQLVASLADAVPRERLGEIPTIAGALERDGLVVITNGELRLR